MNKDVLKDLYKVIFLSTIIFCFIFLIAFINFKYFSIVDKQENSKTSECNEKSDNYLSCLAVGAITISQDEFETHRLNKLFWLPIIFDDSQTILIGTSGDYLVINVPKDSFNNQEVNNTYDQLKDKYTSVLLVYWYGISFISAMPLYFIFKKIFHKKQYDTITK